MSLLDRQFDRGSGDLKGQLPDGWPRPLVRVVEPPDAVAPGRPIPARPRLRLLEVARLIADGQEHEAAAWVADTRRPRTFDLDPTFGLSSTSRRLDRLIRTILADPRAVEPGALASVAARAARSQAPVSPRSLVDLAIERLSAWTRSPQAREIARSSSVRRAFDWMVAWPDGERSIRFTGRGDFLFRQASGEDGLVIFSDPRASLARERLRVLLSALAARQMGLGEVKTAWWVHPGSDRGPVVVDRFDRETVDRAVGRVLDGDVSASTDGSPAHQEDCKVTMADDR